jgi:Tripartite tricarboxylate transporter TctB family
VTEADKRPEQGSRPDAVDQGGTGRDTTGPAAADQGTVAAPAAASHDAPRLGDWVIAAVMLALFATAYFLAEDWPFRAALFPQMVAIAGAALSVLKLVGLGLTAAKSRRAPEGLAVVPSTRAADLAAQPQDSSPEAGAVRVAAAEGEDRAVEDPAAPPTELTFVDDDREDDVSMEYVFASAGGRTWAASLAWIAAFFVLFFILGAYITVPLFALFYLKFAGKASWLGAAIYAVVVGGIIFYVFREVVYIPLPESVFPFLDF